MAIFSTSGARIAGIAAAVPSTAIHNSDYDLISESERKLLIKTTGIASRHITDSGLTTADLCFEAAESIIKNLNWSKDEIDLVVLVTQSPDHFLPASAIILQDRLGLRKTTAAFDISLGCSGFVYGLSVVSSMMSTGGFRKALLLAGDISSAGVNTKDKSTYPLFGDAGTATAIEYYGDYHITFNLQSDGSGKDAIIIPDGGLRHPIDEKTFIEEQPESGIIRHRRNLWLNGLDVFNFSVTEAPRNIKALMEHLSIGEKDVDYFVMHQANKLMNETIRKKLKFPEEKTPYTLEQFGNTSSASIPLTIAAACKENNLHRKWLLAAFGVGLSWGSCYLETEGLICPPVQYI
ncbi:MAG: ketoacyl-ACP synthase III [Bacteroidia bacterium]